MAKNSIVVAFQNGEISQEEALNQLGKAMVDIATKGKSVAHLTAAVDAILGMSGEPQAEDLERAEAWESSRRR